MDITQSQLERVLHKQHVASAVASEIQEHMQPNIEAAVMTLKMYLGTVHWKSAEIRKDTIRFDSPESIVMKILTAIVMSCQKELPFISIGSMIHISDDLDKLGNIQLACDLVAMLTTSGMYSILTASTGSRSVKSLCQPSKETLRLLQLRCSMPPMLEKPKLVRSNMDSSYRTVNKESRILGGSYNSHNGAISLDVINTLNANEYELDENITQQPKPWNREILTSEEIALLSHEMQIDYQNALTTRVNYLEQFQYLIKVFEGKSMFFDHKPDKRGRMYSQGYHFNPAGSGYEKASINLKHKEVVTGEL
jgi:hypothetical protein